MVRRSIATVVAITVVAGCSASSPRPAPSDTAAQSPAATAGAARPGVFTDPPAPHDLQPTLNEAATASAVIGWEGGRLEATGPSGATYTLEIPPEALAVPMTVTMSPLSDLAGFGLDPAPEHVLGVELAPEGLELAIPARLTMAADTAIPQSVATGDYLGHGQDAALVIADLAEAGVTFEVSHFSGYWSVWPLQMEDWRVFENDRQADLERRLQAQIAQFMLFRRLREMYGLEVAPLLEVVRNLMKGFDFEEQVLQNRLALAQNGCPEAQLAIRAFLTYDQQLQFLGIADDEILYAEFARQIPPELFTLAWNLCLDEEYQRCAAIGEWPRLASFLLSQVRQRELWAFPLTANQISDGQDRLKRCGHWRVRLNTSELYTIPGAGSEEQEWTSEIDVRFKADGDGSFGLGGLSIGDGEADVQVNKLDWTWAPSTETNFQTAQPARARINGMAFVTAREGAEPVPTELQLWVFPGKVSFDTIIGDNTTHREAVWKGDQILSGASYSAGTVMKGWQFRARPYRAVFALDGSGAAEGPGGTRQVRIEVILEHTPD